MRIEPIGDIAITVTPAAHRGRPSAAALADALRRTAPAAVTSVLPAFDSVTVTYDCTAFRHGDSPVRALSNWIHATAVTDTVAQSFAGRLIELPMAYGGVHGPDLAEVAATIGLSVPETVARHCGTTYTVAAVGFLPGFAYLDGLDARLHVPRRLTPRTRVPAGSVAIGGPYTGVYPVESPGGWHVIGTTPAALFDRNDPAANRFRVGDRVRFFAEDGR